MRNSWIKIGLITLAAIFVSGCSLKPQSSALDVNSIPSSAKVSIDGKDVGVTPLNIKHAPGEVTLRISPDSLPAWETKVKLVAGSETIVRQEIGPTESQSTGEIYYLEKSSKGKASLSVISTPDAVTIRIDGEPKDFTPTFLDNLEEGDHQLVFTSPGFKDRTVRVKTLKNRKLILNVKLAQEIVAIPTPEPAEVSGTPTPTPKVSPTPKVTSTAKTTGTPTPTPKVSPTPSQTLGATSKPYVEISSTPTGFLRVRVDAGTSYAEVAQVKPAEKYPYLATKNDQDGTPWYQIEYSTGKNGYVVSTYSKKVE